MVRKINGHLGRLQMMTLMTVLGDTQSALTMRASSDNLQQHPQPTFDNLDDNLGDNINLMSTSDDPVTT